MGQTSMNWHKNWSSGVESWILEKRDGTVETYYNKEQAYKAYNTDVKRGVVEYRATDEYKQWAKENPTEAQEQERNFIEEWHEQGILSTEEEAQYNAQRKALEQKETEIQAEQAKTEQLSSEDSSSSGSNDEYVDNQESNSLEGQGSNYDLQPPFNTTDPWVYHDPVVKPSTVARLMEQQNAVLMNEKGSGAYEDRNTENVDAIEFPVIKVNNTELDESMIEYMCITYREFYPRLFLRVVDLENRISFSDVPGPNNVITVVMIPSNQGVYKSISIDFYVESAQFYKEESKIEYSAVYKFLPFEQKFTGQVKYPGCPNTKGKITGGDNEGTGSVNCNVSKQIKPNFWELCHEICLNTGLGFATTDQVKEIEDRLPRVIYNLNFREYILSQLDMSGLDEDSVFDCWIDLYRYLVIVNVSWVFQYDINFRHLTIKANMGLNGTDEDTPKTRTKLVHRTLTNFPDMGEPSDLEFDSEDFQEIVNTDQSHKGFSQQCNTLDVRGVSGLNSVNPQDVEILDNSIDGQTRDEYNTFVENECQSRIDVEYNTNVQTDIRKDFYLRHRSRMYTLKLKRPCYGLYRGTIVNIAYYTTSSIEKQVILQQTGNFTGSNDATPEHPETGDGLMDNRELIQNQGIALPVISKCGLYYIDGMTFEYDKYDNRDHKIVQTLYLIKRGNLTNMQNKHTSPKLDGNALGNNPDVPPIKKSSEDRKIKFMKIGR